jgi:mRNA interferase RelE/StbE
LKYSLRWEDRAKRQLKKLDKTMSERIVNYMRKIVAENDNPRVAAKPLREDLKGLWRYRVGDYRVICDIDDGKVEVVGLDIIHRSEGYRNLKLMKTLR